MVSFQELVKLIEGLVVITGVGSLVFVLFKSGTTKATIQSQKELIDTLKTQVDELRALHIDNEKSIAELRGQVSVYKELPLAEMAKNMKDMATEQKEILKILKAK